MSDRSEGGPEAGAHRYRGEVAPREIARLFWDHRWGLELAGHEPLLIARELNEGSWAACRWLRQQLGDDRLRAELRARRGRGIERRSLRLWQVLLDLPQPEVDVWLAEPERRIWDRRTA